MVSRTIPVSPLEHGAQATCDDDHGDDRDENDDDDDDAGYYMRMVAKGSDIRGAAARVNGSVIPDAKSSSNATQPVRDPRRIPSVGCCAFGEQTLVKKAKTK